MLSQKFSLGLGVQEIPADRAGGHGKVDVVAGVGQSNAS